MSNETTKTTLASVINPEVILEARLAFQKDVNLMNECWVADLTGKPSGAASFPVFNTVSVSKTGEGTDQTTNAAVTPTDVVCTVARRIVKITATDLGLASSLENMNVRIGQLIGAARAKQVDTDILAVMTTNYTSSVGATNSTDVSISNLMSALLVLEGNEADSNLILALHPKQWNHVRGDFVLTSPATTASNMSGDTAQAQQALSGGLLSIPLLGARVLVTPRVATGTDTNDMYLGILGDFRSIGYALKNCGAGLGIPEIELQRDASLGATEYVHNYYDSTGVVRAAGLVLVKSQTY